VEIARSEAFKAFMAKNGFAPMVKDGSDFGDFLRVQDEQWHKVIVGANVGATSITGSPAGSHDPGPWAMPIGVAAFVLLSLIYLAARRKTESAAEETGDAAGVGMRLAGAVGVFVLYLIAMPYLGFFAATSVLSAAAIRWLGKGWGSAIISSGVIMLAVYLLFVRLFRVPLPRGFLF